MSVRPQPARSLAETFQSVCSREAGITTAEADARRSSSGANTFGVRPTSQWLQIVELFANPLVLILLITSTVAAALGAVADAAIIVTIVGLGASLNFIQTYHSQRAIERLRQKVAPSATVRRDGDWRELPRTQIVPGDVIRLSAGDLIPADARLITSRDLHVQQASLTGESLPAEKDAVESTADMSPSPFAKHLVFVGTSVVSGTATAVVIATGSATSFGDVVARISSKPPETEFDRGMRRFGYLILQTIVFLVLFVFAASFATGRDSLESFLFAIALAVGLTPEFLPMITAVTLAQGAVRMARRHVIVKHLAALQNLGSIDILCSDKTGTLTSGTVTLRDSIDPLGQPSDTARRWGVINSFHETGIKSPLDTALLSLADGEAKEFQKLDEMPFDFERRRLSIVVERREERLLIAKGGPEAIVSCCTRYESNGQDYDLDDTARQRCIETYRRLSEEGLRTIAVGIRKIGRQPAYGISDESHLMLVGFITFEDPPIDDAAEAIRELHEDGVAVKILTGDNELVARHVCEVVGLNASRIILGQDLDRMSDSALSQIAERTAVFARVTPAQKNRILNALKSRGHVVGFLGDGINDAPSLHAADVGISAAGAVDVAQAAAEVILQERSLRVLHAGIIEGRMAFGNVMKYLLMGTSSNFGNMFSMAAASIILPFLPMLPTQILLNNLLYDLAQVTIPTDNVDESFIHKPRRWNISLIRRFMLWIGPISSLFDFLTFFVLICIFRADEELFHTGWFLESLATQSLVVLVIRTAGNPILSRPRWTLATSVGAIVTAGLVIPYLPGTELFGFTPLPATYLAFLAAATTAYLLIVEIVKRRLFSQLVS